MKKLELLDLHLVNFMGCKEFSLHPNGQDLSVYGANGTGKTTLFNALCFLFFGKDSSFKTDFEIKTLNSDGSEQHNLEHTVKGLFRWEGNVIELKKVFAEIWTKKRGAATAEFSGHTTDHYIDSVPKSKKEFQEYVSTIATEENFKILTSPFYFAEKMKWTDRRSLLLGLCGNVTDAEVIASDPELARLAEILNGRTFDDHKKVIAAQRRKINEQLDKIPVRIDEVVKSMPDTTGINHLKEIERINKWAEEQEEIEKAIHLLRNDGAIIELRKQLSACHTEITNLKNEVTAKFGASQKVTQDKVLALRSSIDGIDATILNHRAEIGRHKEEQLFLEKVIGGLRQEYKELVEGDRLFKENLAAGLLCCTECGQNLPVDKIEEITAAHNEHLSVEKASNMAIGKAKAATLNDIGAKIAALGEKIVALEEEEIPLSAEMARLEASLHDPDNHMLGLMMDACEPLAAAFRKKELIDKRIHLEESGQSDNSQVTEKENRLAEIKTSLADSKAKIAMVESAVKAQDRKAELEAEQKKMAAEFEKLEADLFLMDSFTRSQVDMLEGRINGMFGMARFVLFEQNINGGIQSCCKVTFNGVPFETSLNNGSKVNTGLDIINTISKHEGLSLPVIIDNSESVTSLIPMDAQVIRLVVSEKDDSLRVEGHEAELQKAA